MSALAGVSNSNNAVNLAATTNNSAASTAQEKRNLIGAAGGQIIQSLGQQHGLPQSSIDAALSSLKGGNQASLTEIVEKLGKQFGASATEIGDQLRTMQHTLDGVLNELNQSQDVKDAKASGGKGGNWLQAMASALGAKMDGLADKMVSQSQAIDTGKPSATTDFTVTTQQFSMLMNAATNSIKSVGEAMANTARKS